LVHRDGTLMHVNPFAAALLGYQSTADALRAENLKRVFGVYADDLLEPGREIAFTSVPLDSEPIRLKAYSSAITWPGGGAVQICLETGDVAAITAPVESEIEKEQAADAPAQSGSVQPGAALLGDEDLRTMLNTATDGIITLDGSGTILALNASAEALFGFNSAELLGKPLAEILAEDGGTILSSYIADLSEGGIASAFNDGREVIGVEKNGGEIPMFLTLGPLPAKKTAENGASSRFCAVLRDLTTWKKTEADLRKGKEVAERANAQKSEFLANISHELRTPLNAIIGFSEVMKSRKFGDIANARYSGYINDIHSSGEHLLSLINDLLDLSKIEAGKLELNFTSVRLEDVIAQCMGLVQDQARDGRVVVRTSLQTDLPEVVADQRAMRQIVLNLLTNAIKFTAPGGQVAISGKLKDSGEVRLKIKDTGRGMSVNELQKAMQPFIQVEDAGGSEGTGTGLGLPLTKALTEANRARFSISSEPDKGTLVTITFPVTRVLAE
ncbi:MAG: PAS domain-containing sensor histidine kinase, partial [Hyphomicrobiales bacterium]